MRSKTVKTARIFLIDDHPMVRRGLKQLLSQESHEICDEAGNQQEAIEKIESSEADLAFLDLSLGKESGLNLIAGLQKKGIRVLVYSMYEDVETIERAFAEGADGYVCKREMEDVLFNAVSDLLAGRRHVSPRVAKRLADRFLFEPQDKSAQLLSEREREIFEMLGRGESNADIAAALFISPRTVETYFYRIIEKLELSGMKELRQYAIRKANM
jgi:DNA-binding NarL/FixJ family response regulator